MRSSSARFQWCSLGCKRTSSWINKSVSQFIIIWSHQMVCKYIIRIHCVWSPTLATRLLVVGLNFKRFLLQFCFRSSFFPSLLLCWLSLLSHLLPMFCKTTNIDQWHLLLVSTRRCIVKNQQSYYSILFYFFSFLITNQQSHLLNETKLLCMVSNEKICSHSWIGTFWFYRIFCHCFDSETMIIL